MAAFSQAAAIGISHLETDLHLTADGILVCFHDHTLDRTTDGNGPVVEHSFEELRALDAGYHHRSNDGHIFRGQGITVPSLEEALIEIPEASFVIDLKMEGLVGPLVELIDRLDAHSRLIVGSFSDDRIDEFREASQGRVATSTGPVLTRSWLIASRVGRGGGGDASALQIPTHMRGVRVVNRRLVETAHKHGLHVHVWTVNEPIEMERLLDFGVDGLVTDRPDLLKEVLVARNQWAD